VTAGADAAVRFGSHAVNGRARFCSLPFKGRAGEGMGFLHSGHASGINPHPNLPLEGEGFHG
jgi:hypothetical protein